MALLRWCSTAVGRVAYLWPLDKLRRLYFNFRIDAGANKCTVLGLLAWLIGFIAALSPEGLVFGVPLIAIGSYLSVVPHLRTT